MLYFTKRQTVKTSDHFDILAYLFHSVLFNILTYSVLRFSTFSNVMFLLRYFNNECNNSYTLYIQHVDHYSKKNITSLIKIKEEFSAFVTFSLQLCVKRFLRTRKLIAFKKKYETKGLLRQEQEIT